jgi:hypothetical protein
MNINMTAGTIHIDRFHPDLFTALIIFDIVTFEAENLPMLPFQFKAGQGVIE